MNQTHQSRVLAIWLILLSVVTAITIPARSETVLTNVVPLKDLIKRWEQTPLSEVERLANGGDYLAQHYMGYCCAEGVRRERNAKEAFDWYQRALKAGYLPSANNLGYMHLRGLLGASEVSKALYYYKFASDHGFNGAQFNLGELYRDGQGGAEKDPEEAMKWFQLSAKNGNPDAMVEIGLQYQNMNQFQKAIEAYRKAAELGSVDGMKMLYDCYMNGRGVNADVKKGLEWITKAASANDADAQCILGYHCELGWMETDKAVQAMLSGGLREAAKWYRLSAEQNWPAGKYHLGLFYLRGKYFEVNEERALELMREAVDGGVKSAVSTLAQMYASGIGEPRNEQERPMPSLMRYNSWKELLVRSQYGLGAERDIVAGASYFCKAVMADYFVPPTYNIADMVVFKARPRRSSISYETDNISDTHLEIRWPESDFYNPNNVLLQVVSFYLKSSIGDGEAACKLGNLYLEGKGVPKSAIKAWAWFTIAAEGNSERGRKNLAATASKLTHEQLEKAQEYLQELRADVQEVAVAVKFNRGGK